MSAVNATTVNATAVTQPLLLPPETQPPSSSSRPKIPSWELGRNGEGLLSTKWKRNRRDSI